MILVWWITDDPLTSPNFPAIWYIINYSTSILMPKTNTYKYSKDNHWVEFSTTEIITSTTLSAFQSQLDSYFYIIIIKLFEISYNVDFLSTVMHITTIRCTIQYDVLYNTMYYTIWCTIQYDVLYNMMYYTIQNFWGRKSWWIWQIARDSPKFSCPKFSFLKVEVFSIKLAK